MKVKRRSDIINKISNHPKKSPLLFHFFCDQVRYFIDMAISRFDLGNSWSRSQARSVAKVIYKINQPIYSHCFFVSCKSGHAFLRHRQFIIWPSNFEVKVTAGFNKHWSLNSMAIFMVIVAQTDSKYGINACIGIHFFYFRLHFNVQFTMKYSGD